MQDAIDDVQSANDENLTRKRRVLEVYDECIEELLETRDDVDSRITEFNHKRSKKDTEDAFTATLVALKDASALLGTRAEKMEEMRERAVETLEADAEHRQLQYNDRVLEKLVRVLRLLGEGGFVGCIPEHLGEDEDIYKFLRNMDSSPEASALSRLLTKESRVEILSIETKPADITFTYSTHKRDDREMRGQRKFTFDGCDIEFDDNDDAVKSWLMGYHGDSKGQIPLPDHISPFAATAKTKRARGPRYYEEFKANYTGLVFVGKTEEGQAPL